MRVRGKRQCFQMQARKRRHRVAAKRALVEVIKLALALLQREVTYPTSKILCQFEHALASRLTVITVEQLAGASFELLEALRADTCLATIAVKLITQKLDSAGRADPTLVEIDYQF